MVDLAGKQLLITGGTGTLGRALVEAAVTAGASVTFTYRVREEVARELGELGAHPIQLDLTHRASIDQCKAALKTHLSKLDGLIHNAATTGDHTVSNMDVEEWDRVVATNLSGVFYLTKALLPLLYKSARARIVQVVSRIGLRGAFGAANYAAAKGGLIAFTKTLASEVGRKGVLVNAVNPGFLDSHMTRTLPHTVFDANRRASYIGEIADAKESAQFILYFVSDAATRVSGQVFHYDSRR